MDNIDHQLCPGSRETVLQLSFHFKLPEGIFACVRARASGQEHSGSTRFLSSSDGLDTHPGSPARPETKAQH